MRRDDAAGGAVPALDGAAILARAPRAAAAAELVPRDLGRQPASWFDFGDLFRLRAAIDEALADPAVAGVVLVQGTDTIEESAFFLDLLHADERPLVVTGAMRDASQPADDGPANLRDAVVAAASPALRGGGCVVVLAGSVEPADDVTKTHATARDTFRSRNLGRLGRLVEGAVVMERGRGPRRQVAATRVAEPIALVTVVVGSRGEAIEQAVTSGARGIVVEATGTGNTHPAVLAAAERAMAGGIPIVLTTRCPAGRVGAAYAFPGGGATWIRAGALPAGFLGGPKARIALALGLGAGLDRASLAALLAGPRQVEAAEADDGDGAASA